MQKILDTTIWSGIPLQKSRKVVVMLHDRWSSADAAISLKSSLAIDDFAILAPVAPGHSWYPYSFLAPVEKNEPYLSKSLGILDQVMERIEDARIKTESIYFVGFSQGACLLLEYLSRNARKYGGVVAFTGGLIGRTLDMSLYTGNFHQTAFLITTGTQDVHIPMNRVEQSASIITNIGGKVFLKVYKDKKDVILAEEIAEANHCIFCQEK